MWFKERQMGVYFHAIFSCSPKYTYSIDKDKVSRKTKYFVPVIELENGGACFHSGPVEFKKCQGRDTFKKYGKLSESNRLDFIS